MSALNEEGLKRAVKALFYFISEDAYTKSDCEYAVRYILDAYLPYHKTDSMGAAQPSTNERKEKDTGELQAGLPPFRCKDKEELPPLPGRYNIKHFQDAAKGDPIKETFASLLSPIFKDINQLSNCIAALYKKL